uniref:Putative Alpha/Beta hydrolase n=1 Tax=mine drainage metagenome TaxID=410659 RepID=E6PV60_9ZZZZ
MIAAPTVLLLPGWQGSGPEHWQSRWEALHGDLRVRQHDWDTPLRGDWICQLEEAVNQAPGPVLLAAHSLGCHLVAGWVAASPNFSPSSNNRAGRVLAALLVAPPDLTRADLPPALHSWTSHPLQRLPFPAHLLSSSDDPFCSTQAAARMAATWGARHTDVGALGHINSASGLGDWPQGRAWLQELAAAAVAANPAGSVAPPAATSPFHSSNLP